MKKKSRKHSLGKRRSEGEIWGDGPQKRAKACHSSESELTPPRPDVGEYSIEANTLSNSDCIASTPSETSSLESIYRASSTLLTTPSQSSFTHDNIRANYHIKDLASFATALEQAANAAFPSQGRSRYSTVNVCLIRWEEDEIEENLQVKPEVERLHDVFRDVYGFNTEMWHIPTIRSHHKLMGKALDFIEEFDQNDNLFIVYYAGHGTMNEHRQSVWTCRRDIQYATVDWSSIQTLFSKASSDVLVLLDCCAAASAVTTSGNGVLETMAACGFEGIAPPPGRFSFTNTLIDVLRDWVARPSFSVASLHTEVLFQLKSKSLERGRGGGRRMEWCRTPVHFIYSSDPKASSIELCRREPRVVVDQNGMNTVSQPFSPQLTSYHDSTALDPTSQENLGNGLTSLTPTGDLTVPHVLISVALEESQESLDLESWRRWLTGFPALVKYARIQGAYKSYSTLLIITLPVMIWDMLPENPACCFIGYVTSENMWTSKSKAHSSGLESHIKSEHPYSSPDSNRTKKYHCLVPGCKIKDKTWLRADTFRRHLKRVHGNQILTEEDFNHMNARSEFWENSSTIVTGLASTLSNDGNTHSQEQHIDMENSAKETSLFQDIGVSSIELIKNNNGDNSPQTRERYLSGQAGDSDSIDNGLSNSDDWGPLTVESSNTDFSTLLASIDGVPRNLYSETEIKSEESLKVFYNYIPSPETPSNRITRFTYDKNQFVCQECDRVYLKASELKSKDKWKQHESTLHFHLECWRWNEENPGGGVCAKVCYRRQTYQEHLSKDHQISDKETLKKKIDSERVGRNCPVQFWCGFCMKLVELKKEGIEAWTERFDHIDDHFMGRHGLAKQSIGEWAKFDADISENDNCSHLSDPC